MKKKITKYDRLLLILFPVIFAAVITIQTCVDRQRREKYIHIDKPAQIELKVTEFSLNHNDILFNSRYYVNGGTLENSSEEILALMDLETPFNLIKKEGSDTLVLQLRGGGEKYLVFR